MTMGIDRCNISDCLLDPSRGVAPPPSPMQLPTAAAALVHQQFLSNEAKTAGAYDRRKSFSEPPDLNLLTTSSNNLTVSAGKTPRAVAVAARRDIKRVASMASDIVMERLASSAPPTPTPMSPLITSSSVPLVSDNANMTTTAVPVSTSIHPATISWDTPKSTTQSSRPLFSSPLLTASPSLSAPSSTSFVVGPTASTTAPLSIATSSSSSSSSAPSLSHTSNTGEDVGLNIQASVPTSVLVAYAARALALLPIQTPQPPPLPSVVLPSAVTNVVGSSLATCQCGDPNCSKRDCAAVSSSAIAAAASAAAAIVTSNPTVVPATSQPQPSQSQPQPQPQSQSSLPLQASSTPSTSSSGSWSMIPPAAAAASGTNRGTDGRRVNERMDRMDEQMKSIQHKLDLLIQSLSLTNSSR
jgi:hypothetical protein